MSENVFQLESAFTLETGINQLIHFSKPDTNKISDGYHTFGQLYEHRIVLYITLCRLLAKDEDASIWVSKTHSDGSVWDGWFLLGIGEQSGGQITYHLPISCWDTCADFAEVLDKAPTFDGHSSEDVLERLKHI